MPDPMQFDFGQNWSDFSDQALSDERVAQAQREFERLLAPAGGVAGRTFLDIGFGQGLSLLSAAAAGAHVVGVDINLKCGEVLKRNRVRFPGLESFEVPVVIGSILDADVVQRVRAAGPPEGFDIVHSWGVLHHTGDLDRAMRHAASLVRPGGHFVVALYNRHWSSLPWLFVKWLYCKSPRWAQQLLVRALAPVIFVAKWLVTGQDPRHQQRGMDFYYNVVDWVGGYPYEYQSQAETRAFVEPLGFECVNQVQSEVPTGCNEFVFWRAR